MEFTLNATLANDTETVVDLPLCRVLLMRDANYPWAILVPRKPDLRELIDLDERETTLLMAEIRHVAQALGTLHAPYKLNVAALGNQVEQLHIHVIARQKTDAAWPKPIWGAAPAKRYEPAALHRAVEALRALLSA